MKIDIKSNLNEGFVKALPPCGLIAYYPNWIQRKAADDLLATLREQLVWQSRTIQLFGRRVLQPRLIHFQGDEGVCYRYSGDDYFAEPWHPDVLSLRDCLRTVAADSLGAVVQRPEHAVRLNSVLINRYRDGQDSMGWHADDEKSLGRNPLIASISLGAVRRFVLRAQPSQAADQPPFAIELGHGSLLIMAGDLQHYWQHQLPKTKKPVAERINLTFRTVR